MNNWDRFYSKTTLKDIFDKVKFKKRLSFDDGLRLLKSDDILSLGYLANSIKEERFGGDVFFINNMNINPTNICLNKCKLCAFYKDKASPEAYALTIDDILKKANAASISGVSELHIVGGLNEDFNLDFYETLFLKIKKSHPELHIQGLTPVEIDFLSRTSKLTCEDVLLRLKSSGLDSIPGGGAEILNDSLRSIICENKIRSSRWLEVMRTAHHLGIRSNATMLFGHMEKDEDIIDHLLKLRELQDETKGFLAFVPLSFHYKNTLLNITESPTGARSLKVLATARIFLDNFEHMRFLWTYAGKKLSQAALYFGADDLGGTAFDEKIVRSAGGVSFDLGREELCSLIEGADRKPIEVLNSLYERELAASI